MWPVFCRWFGHRHFTVSGWAKPEDGTWGQHSCSFCLRCGEIFDAGSGILRAIKTGRHKLDVTIEIEAGLVDATVMAGGEL